MIKTTDLNDYKTYADVITRNEKDIYENSPFKAIRDLHSRTKGSVFEKITAEWFTKNGCTIAKNESSDHDRIFVYNGKRVKAEIKGSSIWKGTNNFRFQQIRPDQDYDIVIFLAMYPDRIDFHYADKETVEWAVDMGYLQNQHGGSSAKSGTYFIDSTMEDMDWATKIENVSDIFN